MQSFVIVAVSARSLLVIFLYTHACWWAFNKNRRAKYSSHARSADGAFGPSTRGFRKFQESHKQSAGASVNNVGGGSGENAYSP